MLIVLYSLFQWLLDYNDLLWTSWQVRFFIIYSPLLFMSPSQNQCIILYTQKKRKVRQKFCPSLIMGFDVVILSSPFFFQITFLCTLFCLVTKLFRIDTWAFVLSLSSLYSTFFNSSWVQCSGQLKKPNLFFLLQVICLTIWLFIWLSRWIS